MVPPGYSVDTTRVELLGGPLNTRGIAHFRVLSTLSFTVLFDDSVILSCKESAPVPDQSVDYANLGRTYSPL